MMARTMTGDVERSYTGAISLLDAGQSERGSTGARDRAISHPLGGRCDG